MTEVPPWPRSVALYPPTVFFFLRFYSSLERREGRVTHLLHRYLVYGSEVSVSVFHFKRSNVVSVFKAGGPWRYRCTNLRVKLTVFPICSKCCSASKISDLSPVLVPRTVPSTLRNAKRNWQRIQDHFFFATFHPLEDYCLEVSRGDRV